MIVLYVLPSNQGCGPRSGESLFDLVEKVRFESDVRFRKTRDTPGKLFTVNNQCCITNAWRCVLISSLRCDARAAFTPCNQIFQFNPTKVLNETSSFHPIRVRSLNYSRMQESEFFAFDNEVLGSKFSITLRSADASWERIRRGESSRAISGVCRKTGVRRDAEHHPRGRVCSPNLPNPVASHCADSGTISGMLQQ